MLDKLNKRWNLSSRREFFQYSGSGLAGMALIDMLERDGCLKAAAVVDPLAPKAPHHAAKAKAIIWLFMEGGPSHIDLFDPKPKLLDLAGKPLPDSFRRPRTSRNTANNTLLPSKRSFKQYGHSGIWISDWFPHISRHADQLAVIRSCKADGLTHPMGVCQMNTGDFLPGRPSMGAWVTYGLGSANRDLPSFVVMLDDRDPNGGPTNWGSGFLPATFQGTQLRTGSVPILNLRPPQGTTISEQRRKLELLKQLDLEYARDKTDDTELEARIRSYELAFQMQSAAPEAVDLSKESAATKNLYGLDRRETAVFGANCLMARRLVERGVRFVELYCGSGSRWDAHIDVEENHSKMCLASDKPIAGLLADLKARGMLQKTLVVWGGEFGRTPFNEQGLGRDHNPYGFTMWLAGGGVKGGQAIGSTDDVGLNAVDRPHHVHDVHASILHLLGLNQYKLTFFHNGRYERPTLTGGSLINELFV